MTSEATTVTEKPASTNEDNPVLYGRDGPVGVLTLNRPEALN